jgi:hypothetical protein
MTKDVQVPGTRGFFPLLGPVNNYPLLKENLYHIHLLNDSRCLVAIVTILDIFLESMHDKIHEAEPFL